VQGALSGEGKALILAISIIAAVLGFTARQIAEAISGLFREGLAPLDRVSVFIEDIQFELPTIPEKLLNHPIDQGESARIEAEFKALKESVILDEPEADRINNIARGNVDLQEVRSGVPYTLEEVYGFIGTPLSDAYKRQHKWPPMIQGWMECLNRHADDDGVKRLNRLIDSELERVREEELGSIFAVLLKLLCDGKIEFPEAKKEDSHHKVAECTNLDYIGLVLGSRNDYGERAAYLRIKNKFCPLIYKSSWTSKHMDRFVKLFQCAHIDQLITLFDDAIQIIQNESPRMSEYIIAWNSILKDRQSSFFILTATLSNVGRFDSFVGSKGRVGIGNSGSQPLTTFIVEEYKEYEEKGTKLQTALYIPVEKRQAKSIKFIARLEKDQRENVRSAYGSGLAYLRLGLLVSIGHSETHILSPSTPFSVQAREQFKQNIENIKMVT
jgi:hypothetical protein